MLIRLLVGFLLVALVVDEIQGEVYTAACKHAKEGQTKHKCAMKCDFDGTCQERVTEEKCGCDGVGYYTGVTNSFENGQSTISIGKRRKKRQSEEVCNLMPNRCSSCRGGTGGTAEAEQTEFNEFCNGNGGSTNRSPRPFNRGSGNRNTGSNSGSRGSSGGQRRVGNSGSSRCQNKESYCDAARPDCSTSAAKRDCKKYCGLCQTSSCVNKESWCESARPDCSTSLAKTSCKKFCGLCGGTGGSRNVGNRRSSGGRGNSNSRGGSSSRNPSCGKKQSPGFTQNGCIYECDGDISGDGTCATEKNGTCGSCFGDAWSGGRCSGEPSGCSSCKSVCRNRGK